MLSFKNKIVKKVVRSYLSRGLNANQAIAMALKQYKDHMPEEIKRAHKKVARNSYNFEF